MATASPGRAIGKPGIPGLECGIIQKRGAVSYSRFARFARICLIRSHWKGLKPIEAKAILGRFYEGKTPFESAKAYLTNTKGRTPLQCPPPNNQTNQPLAPSV
jgi:hypothetical protein